MRIMTPFPRAFGRTIESLLTDGSWTDRLYQLTLVMLFFVVVSAIILAGPGVFVMTVLGIAIGSVLGPIIRQSFADWWDRHFYVIEL